MTEAADGKTGLYNGVRADYYIDTLARAYRKVYKIDERSTWEPKTAAIHDDPRAYETAADFHKYRKWLANSRRYRVPPAGTHN